MANQYHIYGIGNALVDQEFEVTDAFFEANGIEKGVMALMEEDQQNALLDKLESEFGLKKRACGGSAANSIIAAQYFGSKTFYSCNVANDEGGDFYVKDLTAAGVDTNLSDDRPDGVTGRCLVMVTPDAERTMKSFLGITAHLDRSHINEDALSQSDYLYVEGYLVTSDTARQAAIEARQIAKQHGVKTAMTFSDPAMVHYFKDQVNEVLSGEVDLLFCNETELKLWAETENVDTALDKMKSVAKQFAVTRGAKGALLFDGKDFIDIEPFPTKAVDTNGAGDMFSGAFLHALTAGLSFEQAGKLASRASSEVVSNFGPRLEADAHLKIKKEIVG